MPQMHIVARTHKITLHLPEISLCVWQKNKALKKSLRRLSKEALIKSCGQKAWEGVVTKIVKGKKELRTLVSEVGHCLDCSLPDSLIC